MNVFDVGLVTEKERRQNNSQLSVVSNKLVLPNQEN